MDVMYMRMRRGARVRQGGDLSLVLRVSLSLWEKPEEEEEEDSFLFSVLFCSGGGER